MKKGFKSDTNLQIEVLIYLPRSSTRYYMKITCLSLMLANKMGLICSPNQGQRPLIYMQDVTEEALLDKNKS